MSDSQLLDDACRVDEPTGAHEYSDVLSQVASGGRMVIVRRNGADLAAVIPMDLLETVRDVLARQAAEQRASEIDWERARRDLRPPQSWFDDEADNPFEPEEERAP
jgi:hypothetical protein